MFIYCQNDTHVYILTDWAWEIIFDTCLMSVFMDGLGFCGFAERNLWEKSLALKQICSIGGWEITNWKGNKAGSHWQGGLWKWRLIRGGNTPHWNTSLHTHSTQTYYHTRASTTVQVLILWKNTTNWARKHHPPYIPSVKLLAISGGRTSQVLPLAPD